MAPNSTHLEVSEFAKNRILACIRARRLCHGESFSILLHPQLFPRTLGIGGRARHLAKIRDFCRRDFTRSGPHAACWKRDGCAVPQKPRRPSCDISSDNFVAHGLDWFRRDHFLDGGFPSGISDPASLGSCKGTPDRVLPCHIGRNSAHHSNDSCCVRNSNRESCHCVYRPSAGAVDSVPLGWASLAVGNTDQHRRDRTHLPQCSPAHPALALGFTGGQSGNRDVVGRNSAVWLVCEPPR